MIKLFFFICFYLICFLCFRFLFSFFLVFEIDVLFCFLFMNFVRKLFKKKGEKVRKRRRKKEKRQWSKEYVLYNISSVEFGFFQNKNKTISFGKIENKIFPYFYIRFDSIFKYRTFFSNLFLFKTEKRIK